MIGDLRPEGDERRRAIHEVGHFIVARALSLKAIVHYLTLEVRYVSGGGFGVQFLEGNSAEDLACMYLGGLAAEVIGAKNVNPLSDVRRHLLSAGGIVTSDNMIIPTAQSSDIGQVFSLLGKDVNDRLVPLFNEASALLRQDWGNCDILSEELMRRQTLYCGEAEVVLATATATDELLRDKWWFEIELYRRYRRKTTAPDAWLEGITAETPAGPYYEGFRSWRDRDGRKEHECDREWAARLTVAQGSNDDR